MHNLNPARRKYQRKHCKSVKGMLCVTLIEVQEDKIKKNIHSQKFYYKGSSELIAKCQYDLWVK